MSIDIDQDLTDSLMEERPLYPKKAAGGTQEPRSEVDPTSLTGEKGSAASEAPGAESANRRALAAASVLVLESLAVEARLCKENGNLWDREALEMAVGHELRRRFPEALQ